MSDRPRFVFGLVAASTVLGLMGTDLILPSVPFLPGFLGGDLAVAQLTLAAYVGGTALGLVVFGAAADRFSLNALLPGALLALGIVSFACALAPNLVLLNLLRILQGVVAAAPAVFAPGIIKALFDEGSAVRALGLLGSMEAMAPALAPILGAWLLMVGGWQLSFELLGVLSLALAAMFYVSVKLPQPARKAQGSYRRLLGNAVFLRYALSHAFTLGGMLVFVFGMPAVFVHALGGSTSDFVIMQVCGIGSFVIIANLAGRAVDRFGAEAAINAGTAVGTLGVLALLTYAFAGGSSALVITALFVPVNAGLGLRGPPGFYQAVVAADGDDARGAALVILAILAVAAAGTVVAAPLIEQGLLPLMCITVAFYALAIASLGLLPRATGKPGAKSG